MRHRMCWFGKLTVLGVFLFYCPGLWAQTAQMTGRVSDPSDAAVAGVNVVIRNVDTGIARETQTNPEGYYSAPLLPRGRYEVAVMQAGFKPIRRSNITLDEGQALRLDFTLAVGDVHQTVEVNDAAPLLEKETAALSTVVTSDKILQLPAVNRHIMSMAALIPTLKPLGGTNFSALPISSDTSGRMTISGGPPSSNNYQIDGIAAENVAGGNMNVFLAMDAVEEFRVITRNASAEYGRTGGGIVLMTSKSGTNEFHGSAYEFFRNKVLNANDFFSNRNGKQRTDTKLNQWGATLGGPIIKQKTFFFFNYEGFEQRAATSVTRSVPTQAQRDGNFTGTLDTSGNQVSIYDPLTTAASGSGYTRTIFAGNQVPADRISSISKAILTYIPLPNQAGIGSTATNNFYAQTAIPTNKRIYGVKVDHNFNASRRLSARYTWDRSYYPYGSNYYGSDAEPSDNENTLPRLSTFMSYTHILRPTLLLELRGGMNKYGIRSVAPSEGFKISKLGLPDSLQGQMQRYLFPSIGVSDVTSIGAGIPFEQGNYQHTYSGALTWTHGRHIIKSGGEYRLYQLNNTQRNVSLLSLSFNRGFTQGPNPNASGTAIGSGLASLLLGYPSSGSAGIAATSTYTIKHEGFYVQDDWKMTPKLTLNFGVRWEHEGPYTDRYNAIANFDPTAQSTVDGVSFTGRLRYVNTDGLPRGARDTSMHDFQPRFGFAYQLARKTILRGGYGLFFLPTTGNSISLGRPGFDQDTSLVATNSSTLGGFYPIASIANPFPSGLVSPMGSTRGALSGIGTSFSASERWLRRGYSHQFNLNVQHELPGHMMVEAGWSANRGTNLQASRSLVYTPFATRQKYTSAQLQSAAAYPYCGLMQSGLICNSTTTLYSLMSTYPQFGGVTVLDNWADSIYHAFTLRVERRFAHGATILGAYTFSKLIDNNMGNGNRSWGDEGGSGSVQDWDNLRLERAVSQLNVPHRLVTAVLYDLPFGKRGPRWSRAVVGGWQVNGTLTLQSGDTIGVTTSVGGKLYAGSRPNLIGNPKPASQSINKWLDSTAFSVADERSVGNAPRNLSGIQTDGTQNLDMSLVKIVTLAEKWKLQIRGEAINLTNTPTFGQPGTGLGASTFGIISSTVSSPRTIQLGLKLIY